jgi:hypothetical protein
LGEGYEFGFLFDHSSGHAKKREGGLDVKSMNKGFGGELLRNSIIKEQDGYLGPFHNLSNPHMIQVGQEQTYVHSSHNDITFCPFNLTDEERDTKRKDKLVSLNNDKEKDRLKA